MLKRIQNNMLAGLLAIIPILLTLWIVGFLIDFLIATGTPPVLAFAEWVRTFAPEAADFVLDPWFQRLLAVAIVLAALYLLGALTKAFLGRRMLAAFDAVMGRIPLVKTIYGAARKLIDSFQSAPAGVQRVVLIDFPSEKMKAVGQAHGGRSQGDKSPGQVALNWLVCKGSVPIPGAKNARQAQENAGALGWRLEPAEVEELDRLSARLTPGAAA